MLYDLAAAAPTADAFARSTLDLTGGVAMLGRDLFCELRRTRARTPRDLTRAQLRETAREEIALAVIELDRAYARIRRAARRLEEADE